jgi:hypothetical protein
MPKRKKPRPTYLQPVGALPRPANDVEAADPRNDSEPPPPAAAARPPRLVPLAAPARALVELVDLELEEAA